MKKTVSVKALAKEAAYWDTMRKVVQRPGTVCHK
jgi:hypothetical protein